MTFITRLDPGFYNPGTCSRNRPGRVTGARICTALRFCPIPARWAADQRCNRQVVRTLPRRASDIAVRTNAVRTNALILPPFRAAQSLDPPIVRLWIDQDRGCCIMPASRGRGRRASGEERVRGYGSIETRIHVLAGVRSRRGFVDDSALKQLRRGRTNGRCCSWCNRQILASLLVAVGSRAAPKLHHNIAPRLAAVLSAGRASESAQRAQPAQAPPRRGRRSIGSRVLPHRR